jgi:hypothetical protein
MKISKKNIKQIIAGILVTEIPPSTQEAEMIKIQTNEIMEALENLEVFNENVID